MNNNVLRFYCATVLLLTATTIQLHAASFGASGRGTTTAGFLKLGVGGRAAGMAEAYSALADDASALYWNPAALRNLDGGSVTFMHAEHIEGSFFDHAAYAQNFGDRGAFGLGVTYLSAGSIPQTGPGGTDLGNFTPNDLAVAVGYAHSLVGFQLGASAKYIRSTIIDSASAFAVDLGVLSPKLFQDKLQLSGSLTNLGSKMKFESEKEDLPLAFRLGSAFHVSQAWLLGLDVSFPNDNDPYAAVGTEYRIPVAQDMGLALRTGYNSRTTGDLSGVTGVTAGLGFVYQKLALDYGFVPMGDIGLSHRISVSLKF